MQASQLTDHSLYTAGRAHELFTYLRESSPVVWVEPEPGQEGYWAVTGYAPGAYALSRWKLFASGRGTMLRPAMGEPSAGADSMLVLTDPPKHGLIRNAVTQLFTPGAVARLEDRARATIRARLAEVIGAGPFDFIADFATSLVHAIAADLLGVPEPDREIVASMVTAVERSMRGAHGASGYLEHIAVIEYFQSLAGRGPQDGARTVLSALLLAAKDSAVGVDDVILTCDNIAVAAGESTMQAAAAGLVALIEHPDQWRALKDGAARPPTAVEEVLRWASPAVHVLRTTTTATQLGGVEIPAGSPVTIWLPAMNRDEEAFPLAGQFIVSRSPNRHVAFGAGRHFCLGASLSRLVLTILLEELTGRVRELSIEGTPAAIRSYYLNGYDALPMSMSAN